MATAPAKDKVIIWMDTDNPQGVLTAKIAVMIGYEYQINDVSTKYSWKEMRAALPDTVKNKAQAEAPQIFYGTTYIGGYKDFLTHFHVDPKKIA